MNEHEMMAMPQYRESVQAPLLDRPRLELAAALDDRWPARAAQIRFQLQDHRRTYLYRPAGWSRPVLPRMLQLDELVGPWKAPSELEARGFAMHRGLLESVEVPAGVVAGDEDLLRQFPILHLDVFDCSLEDLRRLATSSLLQRLISLGIRATGVGDAGLGTLLESPNLGGIKDLRFADAGLTMKGYEMVAEATKKTLAGLEVGFLTGNTLPDPHEREPGYDSSSGARIHETVGVLPLPGQILEERLGYQKWLHWTSRFDRDYSAYIFERPLDLEETPLSDDEVLGG